MNLNSILNYKCKYKKNTYAITKNLVNFITNYTNKNNDLNKIYKDLFVITDIPVNTLKDETNKIIYQSFNFYRSSFSSELKITRIFKHFLISLSISAWHILSFLIFLNKKKKNSYDLICDSVIHQLDVDRYLSLVKNFKRVCFLGPVNYKSKNRNVKIECFKFNKLFLGCTNFSFKKRLLILLLIFRILKISIFYRVNLFYFFNILIYKVFKYNHIYNNITSKYYIIGKFYDTSAVQNYYFHKNDGQVASCYQKNLCEFSISCFIFTDVLFTLGYSHGKICNKIGGKIKHFSPVGSLYMENLWFKKKRDLRNIPSSDILLVGLNVTPDLTARTYHINEDFHTSYYKYISWFKKISKEFPNKKILLKHRKNTTIDPVETKILENSNIKVLTKDKSLNGTYAYAHKSKLLFSFGSTMIMELLGSGKQGYYVDPELKNLQWYRGVKFLKSYRLKSYSEIKKIVLAKKHNKKISGRISKYFCLNSKDTSKRIANYFHNYRSIKTK